MDLLKKQNNELDQNIYVDNIKNKLEIIYASMQNDISKILGETEKELL
jgi:hypothetical protein